ncbi:cryptochrome [Massarina eburnea CBS 473.64]|uniref:Cryptochrome DASH n=1 Tax=Massarina eburnea CBS 473.64 TaxID=1395130 RepID=A0A6A6RN00_9PLEO|nr:cryptochrome [Massarina eburnea CBS 473.64]
MTEPEMEAEIKPRVLIYILQHDVRLSDNPVFHAASCCSNKEYEPDTSDTRHREDSFLTKQNAPFFTHFLPVYVFPANQIEVSGFLADPADRSPYPEARSRVAGLWRTGPHRAKFVAEGVWDLKQNLEDLNCGSGLQIRVGRIEEVVEDMLDWFEGGGGSNDSRADVAGIWMTSEEGTEEVNSRQRVRNIARQRDVDFKVWEDEKYYIDDRDMPIDDISELPNIYTTYRKSLEPLRSRPRPIIPTPTSLPPLPPNIPPQKHPFEIPTEFSGLLKAILYPLNDDTTFGLHSPPLWPTHVASAHPFVGGETAAQERLAHLISGGAMSSYNATRNEMLGVDFSTKLSAFLAQGHQTARQIHWAMVDFEEGRGPGKSIDGYGNGENNGTAAVRFELLWRDYMRLCARKFGSRMFDIRGILPDSQKATNWNHGSDKPPRDQERWPTKRFKLLDSSCGMGDEPEKTREVFARFRSGRTGIGLIDASNRELFLTGYTSNRARQNVASFLSSHLEIDWRVGAEWYEFLLTDYDMANNWGNWQYVAGVGNDPRQGRIFNPVKQALDYDSKGEYIKAWVPELREVQLTRTLRSGREELDQQKLMGLYQAWRMTDDEKRRLGLIGLDWVERPLVRIQFSVGRGKGHNGDGRGRGRGWRGNSRARGRSFKRLGNEERVGRVESPGVGVEAAY